MVLITKPLNVFSLKTAEKDIYNPFQLRNFLLILHSQTGSMADANAN